MKLLLIKLKEPIIKNQKPCYMPPIGLWSMRSMIYKISKDSIVDICDMHIEDRLKDINNYDVIGISCQFSIQHKEYIEILNKVKQSNAYIIAGGFHASNVEKPDGVNEIIKGSGESWFIKYFGLPAMEYSSGAYAFKDIDSYAPIRFDIEEIKKYWNRNRPHDLQSKTNKWISIETSRGCDHSCKFCGVRRYWNGWKPHSILYMEDYFRYLHFQGIKEVFIEDDNVSRDINRFLWMILLLKENKLWWSTPNGIRIHDVYKKDVRNALKTSTCWRLSLPFETGTRDTARLMGLTDKWVTFKKAERIINMLKDMGILTCGFFIIGYPGETMDSIKRTLEYANNLKLDQRNIYIATPYPGTYLYNYCKLNHLLLYDHEELYEKLLYTNAVIKTNEFNPEDIEKIKAEDRKKHLPN